MKKVVLLALLAAATATAAQAVTPPKSGAANKYRCYYTNYTGPAVDGGTSYFVWHYQDTPTLKRGIEYFDAYLPQFGNYTENYKATFAWKSDFYDPLRGWGSRWEFTFNPSGPQCQNTDIFFGGALILFNNCDDGHSRTCWWPA